MTSVAAVIVVTIVYLGVFWLSSFCLVDPDCFVMGRVAADVLHGAALYGTAWDNKAPLAILFYAVPGAIAPGSYAAIQLTLALWLIAQAIIVYVGLGRESGPTRVVAAVMIVLLPLQRWEWVWASSEHVGNMFACVVVVVAYRIAVLGILRCWECLAAGIALALAFNTRQNLIIHGLLLALAFARQLPRDRRVWRGALAACCGLLAGFAAVLALLVVVSHGSLEGYVRSVFLAPAHYGEGLRSSLGLLHNYRADGVLFFFALTLVLALWGRARSFGLALGLSALLVVLSPMRSYGHYWAQAFPAIAVLTYLAADALAPNPTRNNVWQAIAVAMLFAIEGGYTIQWMVRSRGRAHAYDAVASALRADARSGDTLLAAGTLAAYVYFATPIRTAHTVFWQEWMTPTLAPVLPRPLPKIVDEYRSRPPTLMALEDVLYAELKQPISSRDETADRLLIRELLSDANYREVDRPGGWVILRRGPAHAVEMRRPVFGDR